MTTKKVLTITPLFLVPDVVKSAEYYRDVLGFRIGDYYGDPPCFVFVSRDTVDIMLKLATAPDQVHPNGAHGVWDAYLWTASFEEIREEFRAHAAKIVSESPSTFYGTKEIDVEDRDGYRLCFAQDTSKDSQTGAKK